MIVSFSAEALDDARQLADWYIAQDAWNAVFDLHDELALAVQRVARTPALGTPGPLGTRLLPVHRFPVSLVYRLEGDDVRVIAVAPQRRQPGFWSGRR